MMEYDSDELPEVESRYIPYTSTPADAVPDDSENVSSSSTLEETCAYCALVESSHNIANLTSPLDTLVGEVSTCRMMCLDHDDALLTFIDALCKQLLVKNVFHATNMPNIKKNLKTLFYKILDRMENGRLKFYCEILERLAIFPLADQDKIVTLLNEIASLIVDKNRKQFEIDFSGRIGRYARRNLFRYISETTNFLSLQAVVETLIIFHSKRLDISRFLPESLHFLIDLFNNMPDDKDTVEYHHALSNLTRTVIIDVLEEKAIEVHELVREEFMNSIIPTGRDLYLYLNKKEGLVSHLVVFSPNNVYLEKISLGSIKFDDADLSMATDHWKFILRSRKSWQRLLSIKNKHGEIFKSKSNESPDNEGCDMIDSQDNDEDIPDDTSQQKSKVSPEAKKSDGEAELDQQKEVDDDSLHCEMKANFIVGREHITEYWDPKREFYRTQAGRDWPMMYGSPCAVSIINQHVSVSNSRKRNANFARLEGFCLICKAKHHYVICDSPFKEQFLSNGSIEYEAVEDMIVSVSVEGMFHVVDSNPDITKPVHSRNKGKGLDLRGEERRLLGLKASVEGAASVYREGMAYLQREQIESYNRTSVRSLPVIR